MSGNELNLLCASMLKSKCVPICGSWKSSMYGRMGGSSCARACVRFFRESIIVIASCHGTEQQKQLSIVFSLTRLSHGWVGVWLLCCCCPRRLVVGGGWLGLLS